MMHQHATICGTSLYVTCALWQYKSACKLWEGNGTRTNHQAGLSTEARSPECAKLNVPDRFDGLHYVVLLWFEI
jgi:hypothetical protein